MCCLVSELALWQISQLHRVLDGTKHWSCETIYTRVNCLNNCGVRGVVEWASCYDFETEHLLNSDTGVPCGKVFKGKYPNDATEHLGNIHAIDMAAWKRNPWMSVCPYLVQHRDQICRTSHSIKSEKKTFVFKTQLMMIHSAAESNDKSLPRYVLIVWNPHASC